MILRKDEHLGPNDMNERRKYPRVIMDFPLDYRVLDSPHAHGGLVINASESGLLVHSIKDMPVGTKLNISVLFPRGFELANFELFAEIVWKDIHWTENRDGYQFGLRFIHILEEEYQKLRRLLVEEREA